MTDTLGLLVAFIESITDAAGSYPQLDGTQIITDAYAVLSKHRAAKEQDAIALLEKLKPKVAEIMENGYMGDSSDVSIAIYAEEIIKLLGVPL